MKTIKNRTYNNFMYVYNIIRKSKGYDHDTAVEITDNLFDTLEANPGGNIYRWIDQVVTADEYAEIQRANRIMELLEKGLLTLQEALILAQHTEAA